MIDFVVLSSDVSRTYLPFWPLVHRAWKRALPEAEPILALVTDLPESNHLVRACRAVGRVELESIHRGVHVAAQAKIARYLLAARLGGACCMIHDIDTVPIRGAYYRDLVAPRQPGELLCVGAEVYENYVRLVDGEIVPDRTHVGKFPAGCITAEGDVFESLFNPQYGIEQFIGWRNFDDKEDPSSTNFSDESLLRALIDRRSPKVRHVERGIDPLRDWIDRAYWSHADWNRVADYVEANMLRPLDLLRSIPIIETVWPDWTLAEVMSCDC